MPRKERKAKAQPFWESEKPLVLEIKREGEVINSIRYYQEADKLHFCKHWPGFQYPKIVSFDIEALALCDGAVEFLSSIIEAIKERKG